MRIGIDIRELGGLRTGVGNYLSNLCQQWIHGPTATHHELFLYGPPSVNSRALNNVAATMQQRVRLRIVPGKNGVWWEQIQLPKAVEVDSVDVFFGPAYSIPLRLSSPSVVTIHDISFSAHPEWFSWREGPKRRWLAKQSAMRAAKVLTVSEFSRSEIANHYDIDFARISVVHNGIDLPQNLKRLDGPPLVLFVGSLFNRRHLPILIEAFAQVVQQLPDARLALIGDNRTYPRQNLQAYAERFGLSECVNFYGHLPEPELYDCYRRATAFVFLSEYEGFGMTPLEALSYGVPLVVGDTKVAHEIYRTTARYVPIDNPSIVAREILAVIRNEGIRSKLLAGAERLLDHYSWARAASETMALLEQAAGQQPCPKSTSSL
jgi:glycosyltransferase involved in cell wall biosynthesis